VTGGGGSDVILRKRKGENEKTNAKTDRGNRSKNGVDGLKDPEGADAELGGILRRKAMGEEGRLRGEGH